MKRTVTLNDFCAEFRACGRDNFSQEGLTLLFDYLEQLEQDLGIDIELDVIQLCCEYSEALTGDIARDYGVEEGGVIEFLERNTIICGVRGDTIVFQSF